MMNTNYPDDSLSVLSRLSVSSTGATTKSVNNQNNNNNGRLVGQLVKRILVNSRVSASEWPMKESLLMSMSESILSSSLRPLMPTSNSNSPAILESCQKRLKAADPSLQTAVRFSALATAFLGANGQVYGNVRVTGGEGYTRKAALVYFLLRVAEKSGKKQPATLSSDKSIFELAKRPEIEEASKSNTLNQINSRIQSVLISEPPRVERMDRTERPAERTSHRDYSNIESSTDLNNSNPSSSVWEQFEAMKRQDCGGVGEEAFLRDLIYVLQGLEGNLLLFSESEGQYVVNGRIRVSRPIRALVKKLGEIGSDYRYLQGQVGVHREKAGVLRQSFCRAMAQELAEYLKLVAYLETSLNEKAGSEGSMSLKKVVYWFHEAGILLNFLKELVRDTAALRGGAFLSFLEQFRQHGNDQIRAVITRILDQMMLPYGEMLQGWLREGTLNDPFDEFFITEAARGSRSFEFGGADFWNQKFVLKLAELPKFIPEALARRALVAGKTRKFIQAFLKNPPTHLRYQNPAALSSVPQASECPTAENLLESMEKEMKLAYRNACKQVRRILIEDCQLIEQIRCIKQYVLFCKGDFSMNLLDLLWEGLNRPAGSLFRHNLVGVLESSIEGTRGPAEADWLLANLDVRLLSNDQISGSGAAATGWDVFALDYRVSFPVDCVLDPQSMQEYSKLSRYIWGLKRLEAVLSRCWQNLRNAQVSVSRSVKRELRGDLRKMELLQYEMISFVRQALSVCFETISAEWDAFEGSFAKISADSADQESETESLVDLDDLIGKHRQFLAGLQGKLRLWSSQGMRSKMSVISLGILRFEQVQDALISIMKGQPTAPSLNEMRSSFQSAARHFQMDLDELFMTLQKESAMNAGGIDLVSRLDFNEYHRRRNGFDTRKYL